jgi:hypothetical protein
VEEGDGGASVEDAGERESGSTKVPGVTLGANVNGRGDGALEMPYMPGLAGLNGIAMDERRLRGVRRTAGIVGGPKGGNKGERDDREGKGWSRVYCSRVL